MTDVSRRSQDESEGTFAQHFPDDDTKQGPSVAGAKGDEMKSPSLGSDSSGAPRQSYIPFESFVQADIRVGTIRDAVAVEGADKLYRCLVEFTSDLATHSFIDAEGIEIPVRQIVSGIREFYPDPNDIIGRQVLYIVNLPPRTIRGVESHGMLLALGENEVVFLSPSKPVPPGSRIH
jgi:methionyl-tRNA synthetase